MNGAGQCKDDTLSSHTHDEGQPCAKQPTQNGSLQLLCRMQHNEMWVQETCTLDCTRACSHCQDDDDDNMAYKAVSDDDEDEAMLCRIII